MTAPANAPSKAVRAGSSLMARSHQSTRRPLLSSHEDAQDARRLHAPDWDAAKGRGVGLVDGDRDDVTAHKLSVELGSVLLAHLDHLWLATVLGQGPELPLDLVDDLVRVHVLGECHGFAT